MSSADNAKHCQGKARKGCWVRLELELANGTRLELRIPGVVAASATYCADPLGEHVFMRVTDRFGKEKVSYIG